jgi:hypothetical protein
MPNHEEHCEQSLNRYGKNFSELHTWMDEPSFVLGTSHRIYRHDPYRTPLEAKKLFGENADHACLDHIYLDKLKSGTSTNWKPKPKNKDPVKVALKLARIILRPPRRRRRFRL